MKPDQCLFCTSRECRTRIHTSLARRGGPRYDELACQDHVRDLERDADRRVPGEPKNHVSSTGALCRAPELGDEERRLIAIGEAVMTLDVRAGKGESYQLEHIRDGRWDVWKGALCLAGGNVHLHEAIVAAAEKGGS